MRSLPQPGDLVVVRADRSRIGNVIAELPSAGGHPRVRVFHSATEIVDYASDQLEVIDASAIAPASFSSDLAAGEPIDAAGLRQQLLAAQILHPMAESVFSLHAARVSYVPFQFRPLLRVLRSDEPRLLVADEVGVGKTIETGLILTELSARFPMERVLVVCPGSLMTKWQAEMRRFDEPFQILSSSSLKHCLNESHLDGEWPANYGRSIVNYELLRREEYLQGSEGRVRRRGLLELDPPPMFDLVVFDEVHHARNAGTETNRLVRYLASRSRAVLMLSATPVQTDKRNLYELLSTLRPDLFPSFEVFEEQVEPNKHLVRAVGALRRGDGYSDAAQAVRAAGNTLWGQRVLQADPRFGKLLRELDSGASDSDRRAALIRDTEELHTLAHVMNRTRRRDIGAFTIREVHSVTVALTPSERKVFDAVMSFRRAALVELGNERPGLALDMIERQASSSVHGIADTVEQILARNGVWADDLTDAIGEDVGASESKLGTDAREAATVLLQAARSLDDEDPKFEALLDVLFGALKDPKSPGKVLVFSFFLATIDYLRSTLERRGVRVGVVTGRVNEVERENLRRRFKLDRNDPQAFDVLLSSDVGCEGLDYQFCDRLVNYDLPWNPMRVEQRIGRIDRFGQASPKVIVANLLTEGTVEERVLARCYERLQVFQDSIGDLEEVLGELVGSLEVALSGTALSPAQEVEVAERMATAALLRAEEVRRMSAEGDELIGVAHLVTSDEAELARRSLADSEVLSELVCRYLSSFSASFVDQGDRLSRLDVAEDNRRRLATDVRNRTKNKPRVERAVRALLDSGSSYTFDQPTAVEYREAVFLTPIHPLSLAAADWCKPELPLRSGLVVTSESLPAGTYVVVVQVWETLGARQSVEMRCLAIEVRTGERLADIDLNELLRHVADERPTIAETAALDRAVAAAADALEMQRRTQVEFAEARNAAEIARREAGLDRYHSHLIERCAEELSAAREERVVRMKTSELSRLRRERDEALDQLAAKRVVDIIARPLVELMVEVRHGN